jgi:serine phosphatase RsbU (regulator of sigma subunit)
VITAGEVSVQVDGELIYGLKRTGDIFGEIDAAAGDVCNATVQAKEAVEVVTISLAALKRIQNDSSHELHNVFHVWLTRVLSEKLVLATQKAKRYEKLHNQLREELETAKFVQQAVCASHLADIPGFTLFLRSEFADILGGDVYGVFGASDNHYGVLIGDVSGHGTPAALIAMSVLNSFQLFSKGESSSRRVLEHVNNLSLQSMPSNRFFTAFYGIFDITTRELTYTNAGHHPALVLRDGSVQRLPMSSGIPVGIHHSDLSGYSENSFQMNKKDRLFLFTDGVFECVRGKRMDLSGLEDFIAEHAGLASRELADAIFDDRKLSASGGCDDDLTLIIIEVS